MGAPDLSGYIDVSERIATFREQYPNGRLQTLPMGDQYGKHYSVETIGDRVFIVVTAAAFRDADDERPGLGVAWEPFPGTTPYTRNSELMNAETSAWGRAIVATLAADTRRGVASATEVRNRSAETAQPKPAPAATPPTTLDTAADSLAAFDAVYVPTDPLPEPPSPPASTANDGEGGQHPPDGWTWPVGKDRGKTIDAVGTGSLRWYIENANVHDPRWGERNREARGYAVAEMARRNA